MHALGFAESQSEQASVSVKSMMPASGNGGAQTGMTFQQYAELAKTDPDAYNKLLKSYEVEQERSEIDKLMNFFTRTFFVRFGGRRYAFPPYEFLRWLGRPERRLMAQKDALLCSDKSETLH